MHSCCSRYLECSQKRECVNPYSFIKAECSYVDKLEKGIVFHIKQNQVKDIDLVKGSFILIEKEYFRVSRIESHGWWSRELDNETMVLINKKLKAFKPECNAVEGHINKFNNISMDNVVYFNIDDMRFKIHSFDRKGLTLEKALEVFEFLQCNDIDCSIKNLGNKRSVVNLANYKKIKTEFNKSIQDDFKKVSKELNGSYIATMENTEQVDKGKVNYNYNQISFLI